MLKEESLLNNKEYPLVLDAPFSKLGNEPRKKIATIIPEFAPQIIIMTKDDLQDDFLPEKIGKIYTIVSNDQQNVAYIEEGANL